MWSLSPTSACCRPCCPTSTMESPHRMPPLSSSSRCCMPWSGASAPSSGPCTQPDLGTVSARAAPCASSASRLRALQHESGAGGPGERDLIISEIRMSPCENAHGSLQPPRKQHQPVLGSLLQHKARLFRRHRRYCQASQGCQPARCCRPAHERHDGMTLAECGILG